MNYYTKANQLADQIMSMPYQEVIYGLLFSLAFLLGFIGYMFATDSWNIRYCLGG